MITPIFIFRSVSAFINHKENEEYKERYRKLFNGLDNEKKIALNYPNFFLIRRYFSIALVVFVWDR